MSEGEELPGEPRLIRALRRRDEPPMTRFLAAQLAKHHYFDITRARTDFGYQPRVTTALNLVSTITRRPLSG